jgi:hypothetical protein
VLQSMDRYLGAGMTIVKIHSIRCPRNCGWFRAYTERPGWDGQIVDHPTYGPITEKELVQLDVQSHDCVEHRNALVRLRKARNERRSSPEPSS